MIGSKYPQMLFIVLSKGFKRFSLVTQEIWAEMSKNFRKNDVFSSSTRFRILWGMSCFMKHLLNTIKSSRIVSRSFIARQNAISFRRRYRKGGQSLKMTHFIMTCDVIGHYVIVKPDISNERAQVKPYVCDGYFITR